MENIMKPEDVDSQLISHSLAQVRPAPDDLDDETLALIIDQGMDAVPHEQRSEMLRIIGTNPDVAAAIADLAEHGNASATNYVLGVSPTIWKLSCAACAAVAAGLTFWVSVRTSTSVAGIELLGSGAGSESSVVANQVSTPELIVMCALWGGAILCALPAFLTSRAVAAPVNRRTRIVVL